MRFSSSSSTLFTFSSNRVVYLYLIKKVPVDMGMMMCNGYNRSVWSSVMVSYLLTVVLSLSTLLTVFSFVPTITTTNTVPFVPARSVACPPRWMTAASSSSSTSSSSPPPESSHEINDVGSMRVKEIKEELKKLQVDFTDCFDKESLVARLVDARAGKVQPTINQTPKTATEPENSSTTPSSATASSTSNEDTPAANAQHQAEDTSLSEAELQDMLQEVRTMSVRSLREELASRRIRWAGLLEKEDLVRAVVEARQVAAHFSTTGKLTPGMVAEVTGQELEQELTGNSSPLLLDVFATWCGPCKLVVPELQAAAESFGDKVRVVKMDSEKEHEASGKYRVQGLPSLILFRDGVEIARIEGALMRDQIIDWVYAKL